MTSGFSTGGILISASAVLHCGGPEACRTCVLQSANVSNIESRMGYFPTLFSTTRKQLTLNRLKNPVSTLLRMPSRSSTKYLLLLLLLSPLGKKKKSPGGNDSSKIFPLKPRMRGKATNSFISLSIVCRDRGSRGQNYLIGEITKAGVGSNFHLQFFSHLQNMMSIRFVVIGVDVVLER